MQQQTRRLQALGNANFRRYYLGFWFATCAFWVIRVALGWSAWEISQSVFWTGSVAALTFMPTVLLSPLFGALADNWPLKPAIMVICLVHVGLAVLLHQTIDRLDLMGLCILAGLLGLAQAANHPLRLQMVPRLVDRSIIANTIGLTSFAFNVARIIGPAIAGILIDRVGAPMAYLVAAGGYGAYFLALAGVQVRPIERDHRDGRSLWSMIGDGLRYALTLPIFLPALMITLVNGLVARGLLELLPAFTGEILAGGAETLAMLTSSAGVGAVASAVVIANRRPATGGNRRHQVLSLGLGGLAVLGLGLSQGLPLAALLCALVGFSASLTGISTQAHLQIHIDDRYRGRVMSFWTMLSFGAPVLGTLIIGGLSELIGLSAALSGAGILGICTTTVMFFRWRRAGVI